MLGIMTKANANHNINDGDDHHGHDGKSVVILTSQMIIATRRS